MPALRYILDGHGCAIPEPDLERWTAWFAAHPTAVARERVNGFVVATVFTGVAGAPDEEPPQVWEAVVLDEHGDDVRRDRCAGTRRHAEAMHRRMVLVARDQPAGS